MFLAPVNALQQAEIQNKKLEKFLASVNFYMKESMNPIKKENIIRNVGNIVKLFLNATCVLKPYEIPGSMILLNLYCTGPKDTVKIRSYTLDVMKDSIHVKVEVSNDQKSWRTVHTYKLLDLELYSVVSQLNNNPIEHKKKTPEGWVKVDPKVHPKVHEQEAESAISSNKRPASNLFVYLSQFIDAEQNQRSVKQRLLPNDQREDSFTCI